MDYGKVGSALSEIKTRSDNMGKHLKEVWSTIEGMKSAWTSEVFEEMKKQYTALEQLRQEQTKVLTNRSEILDTSMQNYKKTEQAAKDAVAKAGSFLKF